MMKKLLFLIVSLLTVSVAYAQMANPVKVQCQLKEVSATEAELVFNATIEQGWHMYSTEVVEFGPTPTTLEVEKISGAKLKGKLAPKGAPIKKYEEMFEADVYYFEHAATFVQKLTLEGGKYHVEGYLEYGACNDQSCTPPTKVDFNYDGEAKKAETTPAPSQGGESVPQPSEETKEGVEADNAESSPLGGDESGVADSVAATSADLSVDADLWAPVVDKLKAFEEKTTSNSSLGSPLDSTMRIFVLDALVVPEDLDSPPHALHSSTMVKKPNSFRQGIMDDGKWKILNLELGITNYELSKLIRCA